MKSRFNANITIFIPKPEIKIKKPETVLSPIPEEKEEEKEQHILCNIKYRKM